MHTTTVAGFTLAFVLGTAPIASAAETAAQPAAADAAKAGPSDKAQIAALEKRFAAAFNAKDVNKIMAGYARSGLFVYDVAPPRAYVGWDAYKKDWEGLLKDALPGKVTFSIADLAITVDGAMAYSHSTQTIEATGGPVSHLVVRVTDVYRKTGGRWQIVHEHVSVPVDPATGKADLLSKP
jgi:uncharacterized protein (TIGR02246 family)